MTLFQAIAALFGLWMMYEIMIHGKKKLFSAFELGIWLSLWFVFILIALFPGLLLGIAHQLNFSRVFDLVVVVGFMVLSVTIFLSYFSQKEMKQKLTDLIEDMAIEDGKKQLPRQKASKK